jgi:hypothetical protein
LSCDAALAAQGPGTGAGTASSATQFVLAIIVYGTAALVVAAGLIGAVRQATLPAPNQNIENNPMDSRLAGIRQVSRC